MTQSFGMVTQDYTEIEFLGDHPVITISGTLAAGNLVSGTVVGKVTATGKYVILAPAASDGSESAAGILIGDLDASSAEEPGIFLAHGEAVSANLTWPAGITDNQKAAAIAQLRALGIFVK